MAIAKGHGNPDWTEDEVVLALDLYFDLKGSIPPSSDERVQQLSVLLRSFPYHAVATRKPSFRNAAGVAFKLQNLRQVATGKGLPNTSKVDAAVWRKYGASPIEAKKSAELIKEALTHLHDEEEVPDDECFSEGRTLTYLHQRRERNPNVKKRLVAKRKKLGLLCCDLCGYRAEDVHQLYRDAVFEAHHLIPLASLGATKTKLSDMALLCTNCHKLIHKVIAVEKKWMSVDEARSRLGVRSPTIRVTGKRELLI